MATAAPKAIDLTPDTQAAPGSDVQLASSIQTTDGLAEVVISDMESICKARKAGPQLFGGLAQAFGITVLTTSTATATVVSTSVSTSIIKRTVVLACNPLAFTALNNC